MPVAFHPIGPIDIPFTQCSTCKRIEKKDAIAFWKQTTVKNLANKVGCYIFATRVPAGITPWYVGKTRNSFDKECFTDRNRDIYNQSLAEYRDKQTPCMYLILHQKQAGPINRRAIKMLEGTLITLAEKRNSKLKNKQLKQEDVYSVIGVLGKQKQGSPPKEAAPLKSLLGLSTN